MFGEFCCTCGRTWSSGYAWIEWDEDKKKWMENWQKCRDCNRQVVPTSLRPLRYTSSNASQKPHDSAACEMCRKHGDCRNFITTGDEDGDWDDDTSIRSESSSIRDLRDDLNLSDSGTPVNSDEETTDEFLSREIKKLNTK